VLAGIEAEEGADLAGDIEAGDIAELGDNGHGDGELDAAECLQSLNEGSAFPGSGAILEFGFDVGEMVGAFGYSADVFLENDLLGRGGQSDSRELVEMSGAPGRSAGVVDVVAQQKGFEAELGCLEIVHGVLASAGEIADGFIVDVGDVDGGKIAGSQETCEGGCIAAIGLDSIAGFLGDERRCDDEAGEAFLGEVAIEGEAARSRFVGEDEAGCLGLETANELVDVALLGADGADEGDSFAPVLGCVGDGDGVLMDIEADEKCGIMGHG
jgi:hypothetical protein